MKNEEKATDIAVAQHVRSVSVFCILHSAFCILLILLAALPIWLGPGILNTHAGGDSPFLLIRVHELVANLRAGIFPARWMPNAAFGLGYPFFNFYASLPYYLAALLSLLGIDLVTAIKLTQTLGMAAAALGMFRFARSFLSVTGATLAAAAYTLAPFHLVNIYVRGDSLSEFYAFVWYPLILWAITALTRPAPHAPRPTPHAPTPLPYATLALSLTGLLLTHNVSALLFAPFIVGYTLIRLWQAKQPVRWTVKQVLWLLGAALLAMGMSAWFWLPALGETGLVQLEQQTTGYFYFANHFRELNLVQWTVLFDYSVDPALSAIAMSAPQVVLALAGVLIWRWRKQHIGMWFIALLGALVSTLMMTPLSALIWRTVPLLALAQFPWRYLSVQALFVALFIGALVEGIQHSRLRIVAVIICQILLALNALWQLPNERLNVQAKDITPRVVQLYEWQTGNIGTTIRAEYLPKTALPWPRLGPALMSATPTAYLVSSAGTMADGQPILAAIQESRTPTQQAWRVRVQADTVTFTLPLLAAPGWVDASALPVVPIQAYSGSGWVMLTRPRGEHRVVLTYAGTPLQNAGEAIALAAGTLFIISVFAAGGRLTRHGLLRASLVVTSMGLLIFAVALLARVQASALPALNAIDADQRLFPHRGPLTLRTVNGQPYVLQSAILTPTQVRAGEVFTVTLGWQDDVAPMTLTAKLEMPPPSGYAINQRVFRYHADAIIGDARQFVVQMPSAALPGPTLLRLTLSDDAASIFIVGPTVTDTPPNALDQPMHVFSNGIALHQADLVNTSPHDICVRANWSRTARMQNQADALQVSFRLMDMQGELIAQSDGQPQAGLAPTWAWPLNALIEDSYCGVPVKRPLQEGERLNVQVIWYRRQTLEEVDRVLLQGEGHDTAHRAVPMQLLLNQ